MARLRRFLLGLSGFAGVAMGLAGPGAAQPAGPGATSPPARRDLIIVNVRIVTSAGPVIENGSLVVRDGRIAALAPGRPRGNAGRGSIIDGKGMTAVPGFIDAHKHVASGPAEREQMQSLLEAGFTTILSGGGTGGDVVLRDRIRAGIVNGPEIIPSERINLKGTPQEARAAVRAMAARGILHTGEIALTPEPAPPRSEIEVLAAVVDEAARAGVQVNVHAVSTPAMTAAIDAGVRRLVHLPNKDWTGYDAAERVRSTGSIVLGLIGFGAPIIDVFAADNTPRFRNGGAWPESIAGANRDAAGRATGTEAGYTLVNARRIWDATAGAGIGYCSDQNYPDGAVIEHELKSYSVMFSNRDILRIIGPNTAAYLNLQGRIGSLDVGKEADIVLLDGDPIKDWRALLKVRLVVSDGKLVVDKRTKR